MKQLLLSLLTFFLYIGCTENRIASKLGNTYPDIFPDYKGISIPINIAPLNFTVRNSSHIKAVFSNNNQPLFSIEGKNKIDIPLKKWQHMLSDNTGKQIDISISGMNLIRKVYNTNLFLFILQQTLSTLILPTD